MMLWKLFLSFFKIGLVSFGGGYAAMAPIQSEVVNHHGWLTLVQFTDLITISQMTPGPIALNSATFVGLQVAGFPGAVVATLGNVMPSIIIVGILAYVYFRFSSLSVIKKVLNGIKPTVVAMIASAGVSILISALWINNDHDLNSLKFENLILLIISIILLLKFKFEPVKVILLSGLAGIVINILI